MDKGYKLYAFGWCYFISSNTSCQMAKLEEIAKNFAKEINVDYNTVLYDGRIRSQESSYLANHQIFSAQCKEKPDNYKEINISIWDFIKSR